MNNRQWPWPLDKLRMICKLLDSKKTVSPFQTLNCISTEKNQTVVFPLPIDLVDGLLGTKGKEVLEADEDTAEA